MTQKGMYIVRITLFLKSPTGVRTTNATLQMHCITLPGFVHMTKSIKWDLPRAHIRAGVKQANSTGTKLNNLHNKKDLCNKNITFVSKITLNNKYAK